MYQKGSASLIILLIPLMIISLSAGIYWSINRVQSKSTDVPVVQPTSSVIPEASYSAVPGAVQWYEETIGDTKSLDNPKRLYLAVGINNDKEENYNIYANLSEPATIQYKSRYAQYLSADITIKNTHYQVITADGGRGGPCPFEEATCSYTDEKINESSVTAGSTLRIWKAGDKVFMLNPQSISINQVGINNLTIFTANNSFSPAEIDLWRGIIKSITSEKTKKE